jgi:hypothetical protein
MIGRPREEDANGKFLRASTRVIARSPTDRKPLRYGGNKSHQSVIGDILNKVLVF